MRSAHLPAVEREIDPQRCPKTARSIDDSTHGWRHAHAAGSLCLAAVDASARRVLIALDDEVAAVILREVLTGFGHTLEVALDEPQIVAKSAVFRPDVVVLDLSLSSPNDRALAQKLRHGSAGHKLRLIAMSGYGRPQDTARALAAGFDQYFVKPVDVEALALAIAG
jgi:CheY-like chemotaxis protein